LYSSVFATENVMPAETAQIVSQKETKANALQRLSDLFTNDMLCVNKIIIKNMQSDVVLIPQLASHLIAAGGKRVRPLLTIAAARLCAYDGKRPFNLAAAVEFIHTATLLHDDVVDASNQRRGQKSANAIFGNEASVLVGDFLFSRSFQLMVDDGSLDVLRILSNASAIIAEGEVLQLVTTNNITTTQDQYLDVIASKTAALFAAACEVGGVCAKATNEKIKALHDYGHYLGIAFQMSDDVLDYLSSADKMGKNVGDDFKEGKITLPVILAIQKSSDLEKEFWQRTFGDLKQEEGDLEKAINLFKKYNSFEEGLKLSKIYAQKAKDSLNIFSESELRTILTDLIDFVVERDH